MATAKDTNRFGLNIEVVADLACPVSFLGKRSLDQALTHYEGPSQLVWHPFQLNPDIPAEGTSFERYLTDRFGGRESVEPALQRLTEAGRAAGIRFDFGRLKRVPNTLDAHRVMHYAAESGRQHQLADELFSALFERGEDIGDHSVLIEAGGAVGLDPEQVVAELAKPDTKKIVMAREAEIRKAGIPGIPSYLLNRQLLLPGAQDLKVFLDAFQRMAFPADDDEQLPPSRLH